MSVTFQVLENEPILIVTHGGRLTREVSAMVTREVAKLTSERQTPLYGIVDVRNTTSDFHDVIAILAEQSRSVPGTIPGNQVLVVLVGSNMFIRFFQKAVSQPQFGGVTIPVYYTLEEALDAVRAQIRADSETNHSA